MYIIKDVSLLAIRPYFQNLTLVQVTSCSNSHSEQVRGRGRGKLQGWIFYDLLCRTVPLFGPHSSLPQGQARGSPCSPAKAAGISVDTEDAKPQTDGILNSPFPRRGILRQPFGYSVPPSQVSVAPSKVGRRMCLCQRVIHKLPTHCSHT